MSISNPNSFFNFNLVCIRPRGLVIDYPENLSSYDPRLCKCSHTRRRLSKTCSTNHDSKHGCNGGWQEGDYCLAICSWCYSYYGYNRKNLWLRGSRVAIGLWMLLTVDEASGCLNKEMVMKVVRRRGYGCTVET